MGEFREAPRELHGLTAKAEKRVLLWLAARTPGRILFDIAGFAGIVGLALTPLVSGVRNTRRLYAMERLP